MEPGPLAWDSHNVTVLLIFEWQHDQVLSPVLTATKNCLLETLRKRKKSVLIVGLHILFAMKFFSRMQS